MTGHHHHRRRPIERREPGGERQAVIGAQLHVDHGQVGPERARERLGLGGGGRHADDLEVGLGPEPVGQRPREGTVVVDEKESGGSHDASVEDAPGTGPQPALRPVDVTLSTRHTSLRRRKRLEEEVAKPLRTSRPTGGCRVAPGIDD